MCRSERRRNSIRPRMAHSSISTPNPTRREGGRQRNSDEVRPRVLGVLVDDSTTEFPADVARPKTLLADWLCDPGHPLTARVLVNRLWQGHFGAGDDFLVLGLNPNLAAVGHGLDGVEDEVMDDLMDLPGIDFGGREIGGEIEFGADVGAAQCEVRGFANEFDERSGLANGRAAFGEGQELLC